MGRPRGFDEAEVVRRAAALFSVRAYDGTSIDDLVAHLGVHRNSLYKTFGSKRGLYLAALRWSFEHDLAPLLGRIARKAGLKEVVDTVLGDGDDTLDLLLMASVEQAPVDPEVAALVATAFTALDQAVATAARAAEPAGTPGAATAVTSVLLGLRVRTRSGTSDDDARLAGTVLAQSLRSSH